jgi:hypothetical protein
MISRRQLLATTSASTATAASGFLQGFSLAADSESDKRSAKKGWAGGNAKFLQQFGARWYYTWSPKTRPSQAVPFVPMIKGAWSLKQVPAIKQMKGIDHLLSFNEPERAKQGNISVEQAIELWPKLVALAEAKNLRLGSPAPSSDKPGMDWLAAFMERAKHDKLRVDFVAVHWYRSRDAGEFEDFIKKVYRDFDLPIWVTEFNGWAGPEEENYEFLKDSLKFLERDRNVERYAYFNPPKGKPHSLLDKDGKLTRMGELYRDA